MLYQQIINTIISKLSEYGLQAQADEIKDISSAAYMSQSELLGTVTESLISLTKRDDLVAKLISKEVVDMKNLCRSIGLTI